MKFINLDFFGPYDFISDKADVLHNCEHAQKPGIYLWTVKMPNDFYKILYIGETRRTFYERTREHLLNQLSGLYEIQDPMQLNVGVKNIVWFGLYGKGRHDKIFEYISRYDELSSANIKYISLIKIFVAPLEIEDKIRQSIEAKIASIIISDKETGSIFPLGVQYKSHKLEESFRLEISSTQLIQGLPKDITFDC